MTRGRAHARRLEARRVRRLLLAGALLALTLTPWTPGLSARTGAGEPARSVVQEPAALGLPALASSGGTRTSQIPDEPSEDDDTAPNDTPDPEGAEGDGACATALRIGSGDTEAVAFGRTCARTQDDGAAQGDAVALSIFGNDIGSAASDSREGPDAERSDTLAPICEGTGGQLCLQILYAESSSSEEGTGSSAESHAALLFLCLGGSNPAPKADCDGVAQVGVGESHSQTSTSGGVTTSDSESQVLDICLGGEDPATGFCSGLGIGIGQTESHSEATTPGGVGTSSRSSVPLSLEAQGEDQLGFSDPAGVFPEPVCPTVICFFVNQGESFEYGGGSAGRQDSFAISILGVIQIGSSSESVATSQETLPRVRPPQPTPPPPPPSAPLAPSSGVAAPAAEPSPPPEPSPTPSPSPAFTFTPPSLASPVLPDEPQRTEFVRSFPSPFEIDWVSGRTLVTAALAGAGIPILLFPGGLFGSTFEEHYDEIRGWFRRFRRKGGARGAAGAASAAGRGRRGRLSLLVLVTALLYGFLSPDFGWNQGSLALFLGVLGTIILGLIVGEIVSGLYLQRRVGERMTLSLFPWAIVIAGACVLITRAIDFAPGYLYGSVAAASFTASLSKDLEGRAIAISSAALLTSGLVAWFLWDPVKSAASSPDAGLGILVMDAILAAMFVGALEGVLFALIPMSFMDGQKLLKWSRLVWALLFGVSLFLFIQVLLDPGSGYIATSDTVPFFTVLALFVSFALFSIAFWAYFRFRKPRDEEESEKEESRPPDRPTETAKKQRGLSKRAAGAVLPPGEPWVAGPRRRVKSGRESD
ncbi:MAG: FGLLP motif-containing membrane protein [Actinomycetota bacterium]